MCGRYVLFNTLQEIGEFLNATSELFEVQPNYNAAPTHEMPVAFTDEHGVRKIDRFHWGFMGWKPKPGAKPFYPINTRDDSLTTKPMWKKAFTDRRCIVPANGFYEWAGKKGSKTPHYIYPEKDAYFGFAGIYSDLTPDGSESQKSYSIITTTPNKLMESIHDRMPVILHQEEFNDWLNPEHDDKYLVDFLRPYPDDAMGEHIVSKEVGNVRNNHQGLVKKAELF